MQFTTLNVAQSKVDRFLIFLLYSVFFGMIIYILSGTRNGLMQGLMTLIMARKRNAVYV